MWGGGGEGKVKLDEAGLPSRPVMEFGFSSALQTDHNMFVV